MCEVEKDAQSGCLQLSRSVNTCQGISVLQKALHFQKLMSASFSQSRHNLFVHKYQQNCSYSGNAHLGWWVLSWKQHQFYPSLRVEIPSVFSYLKKNKNLQFIWKTTQSHLSVEVVIGQMGECIWRAPHVYVFSKFSCYCHLVTSPLSSSWQFFACLWPEVKSQWDLRALELKTLLCTLIYIIWDGNWSLVCFCF